MVNNEYINKIISDTYNSLTLEVRLRTNTDIGLLHWVEWMLPQWEERTQEERKWILELDSYNGVHLHQWKLLEEIRQKEIKRKLNKVDEDKKVK